MAGAVTFLSDYGLDDEFVGIIHAVIEHVAPGATVVDLSHNIPRHDIRAGALMLWRSIPWLVPGVVLAVVDPGVATSRRAVALEVRPLEVGSVEVGALEVSEPALHLVGPDNGLLLPAAMRIGGIASAVDLGDPGPTRAGSTFAGRDVMAPVAARLAAGVAISELGSPIDPGDLAGEAFPGAAYRPGLPPSLDCAVTWVDHFGNIQLGASADDLALLGDPGRLTARIAGPVPDPRLAVTDLRVVIAYSDLSPGELGVVIDSYQMLSICLREAKASDMLGLQPGSAVVLSPSTLYRSPNALHGE